jgi:hypothetical protein
MKRYAAKSTEISVLFHKRRANAETKCVQRKSQLLGLEPTLADCVSTVQSITLANALYGAS